MNKNIMLPKRLRTFLRLKMSDRLLLLEAVAWLGVARLAILTIPMRRIRPYLGQHLHLSAREEPSETLKRAWRIGWAVRTMSRYTPWTSNCFPQAIAAKRMLQRRQIKSTLYLGFSKENQAEPFDGHPARSHPSAGSGHRTLRAGTNDFEGHAWLRCGPLYLTGGRNRHQFVALSTFAEENL